jgi:hemolysin activation/secretion protein
MQIERTDGRAAPRRGLRLRAELAGYPAMLDAEGASGRGGLHAEGYAPLVGDGLHLALRAGGVAAWGDFPAWDAAAVGGRRSLRGFTFGRYAGDRAAYGGAELRAPVGEVELIMRGELGVFALVDAGRVWLDGASPGGWHTGYGGGLWFDTLGRAISVAFATGEREQLYVWFGLPF